MLDQDTDLPDPDQWLADFKSRLNDISDLANGSAPTGGPGLLGSLDDLRNALGQAAGQSDEAQTDRFSVADNAAQRQPGGVPLPYRAVPSPHAGHYATPDEAAKAAASDVPSNTPYEYGAYLPRRYVTNSIDLGDGFGPQEILYADGYDYGGLYTSRDTGRVTLGPPPPHLGGWFHSHPWDSGVDNYANQRPSRGAAYDEGTINFLHEADPLMETYILGPDGVLRRFLLPSDRGEVVP